jgi:type III secretory pathway component EscS
MIPVSERILIHLSMALVLNLVWIAAIWLSWPDKIHLKIKDMRSFGRLMETLRMPNTEYNGLWLVKFFFILLIVVTTLNGIMVSVFDFYHDLY